MTKYNDLAGYAMADTQIQKNVSPSHNLQQIAKFSKIDLERYTPQYLHLSFIQDNQFSLSLICKDSNASDNNSVSFKLPQQVIGSVICDLDIILYDNRNNEHHKVDTIMNIELEKLHYMDFIDLNEK